MIEARCLVCGSPMGELMTHLSSRNHEGRETECCSEECEEIYYDQEEQWQEEQK